MIKIEEVKRLTQELGQGWGFAHAERVYRLGKSVGADLHYNREAFAFAVYLHDWGAFPKYYQPGVDHALRSRQVAEAEILPRTSFAPAEQKLIAEAIERHDYRDARPATSPEGLLLREADWLDMLGAIGIVREFAWGPNNLQICYERVQARLAGIQGRLTLPVAQALATERIARMQRILDELREESLDVL